MQDDISVKIVHYDEIDKKQFCKLQRMVFSPLIKHAGGDDSYITPSFFEWKYNTPVGKAYIAFIEKDGEIIGSNSMIPINLVANGKLQKSWQSCDTAVLAQERGKGYFSKCISQLKTKINYGEYFWGFPNGNSINGFLKLGWIKSSFVTLWIKPLIYLNTSDTKNNKPASVDLDLLLPDEEITAPGIYLSKTKEYFYWRYLNHPCCKYFVEDVSDDKNNRAIIVFRELNIKGKKILMLMDFVGCYKALRKNFYKKVSLFAKANNNHYIGYWGNALTNIQLFQLGFLPVPDFVLPKKHILCSELIGKVDPGNKNAWVTQTGDYDLF